MFYLKSEIHGSREENAGKGGDARSCFRVRQQELRWGLMKVSEYWASGAGCRETLGLQTLHGKQKQEALLNPAPFVFYFSLVNILPTGNKLDPTSGFSHWLFGSCFRCQFLSSMAGGVPARPPE